MRAGWLVLSLLLGGLGAQDIEEQAEPLLTTLPQVLIGDPNDVDADDIGPAITDEEFAAALADPSLLSYRPDNIDNEMSPLANQTIHFQGDIQIQSEDQFYELMLNNETNGQSSAISNPSLKWENNEIPYYISSYFYSTERSVIVRAMAEYHKETCLKFVPRTTQRDYIHILKGQGCSSAIGRVGGVQTVSLGFGCVHLGTVIHELMHAAGFWHEQSRYDRDSFVIINYNNIIPELAYNFNRKTRSVTQDLGLPYDYKSVMHYDQYAFAWNRRIPTIYPRQNGAAILGQRGGFSELDKMGLNLLYKCSGKPSPKPSGCTDTNSYCSDWARKGQCNSNSDYMHIYCKESCNKCDKTVKPKPKPSPCVDENKYCQDWAAKGYCISNEAYMKVGCKKSCNLCGTTKPTNCVDNDKFCSDWASKGQCQINPGYMKVGCPKSCNTCGEIIFPDQCVDTNAFCPDWSIRGYCQSNPSYMHASCRKSCNQCSTTTTTTLPPITKPTEKSTEAPTEMTTVTDLPTNETIPITTVNPTEISTKETMPMTTVNPTETSVNETTSTTVRPTEKPELCEDDNEFCSDWAFKGQCESNSGFMHVKCKKSCDRCNIPKPTGSCLDDNEFCPDWATKGHCESNAEFMKESCKRSCKICSSTTTTTVLPPTSTSTTEEATEAPLEITTVTDSPTNETRPITTVDPTETSTNGTIKTTVKPTEKPETCEDDNVFCSDWAFKGQCESNSGFMHVKCKKSCDRCNIPKPTGNCLDDNEFCSDWATKGHCESNAEYMKESCKRSCTICQD